MLVAYIVASALTYCTVGKASRLPREYIEHERREVEAAAWIKGPRVDGDLGVPFRISLTQNDLDRGHGLLMEISDPDSPSYGKRYTSEEVDNLFAPSPHSINNVSTWLESSGISSSRVKITDDRQWIYFHALVSELESLLHTTFHKYTLPHTGDATMACEKYHLPRDVKDHVDFVVPGVMLLASPAKRDLSGRLNGNIGKRSSESDEGSAMPPSQWPPNAPDVHDCHKIITPSCIRRMYNISSSYNRQKHNQIGIYEEGSVRYSQKSLNDFFNTYLPHIKNGTHPQLFSVDGGKAPLKPGGPSITSEPDLDIQLAFGLLDPKDIALFQVGDGKRSFSQNMGLFNNLLDAIDGSYCNYTAFGITGNSPKYDEHYPDPKKGGYKGQLQCGKYKPPSVISISYLNMEPSLPMNYQRRQCNEWMKLAMQGTTATFASGDTGVELGKVSSVGPGCLGKKGDIFIPGYPINCPYVLVVGGTYLPKGASVDKDEEIAAEINLSSGSGFSNIYPRPEYQDKAVEHYLTHYGPPYKYYETKHNQSIGANGGIYNRAGRAYPDVAMVSDHIGTFTRNKFLKNYGTSAGAPLWGSIITRINAERLAINKTRVGFVHPVLYKNPQVFNDITVGNNSGCGTAGFNASKGWDAVTGLGTPNYPKLLKLFLDLP